MVYLGQKECISNKWSEEDVNTFSSISGDKNPIHLDQAFAEKTQFKGKIVHGFLVGSLISSVIGNKLPGNGTIYLYQEMKFLSPVFIDEEITCEVEVIELWKDKARAKLKTTCLKSNGEFVIQGFALVKNDIFI
jgi:3-hydroxybutyryl-CoA dehydratase